MSENGESQEVTLARIDERLKNLTLMVTILATTVEELKSFRWKLMGACSVLGGVFGFIAKSL